MFLTKKHGVREMPVKEPVCILRLLCWKIVQRPEPSSKRTNTQANEKIEIWIQDLVNAGWRYDEGKTKFGQSCLRAVHAGWEWGRREEKRTLHWLNGWWPVYRPRLRSFLQKKSNYVEKPRPWAYGGYLMGTPKSSILVAFSIINHPFWGSPLDGNPYENILSKLPPWRGSQTIFSPLLRCWEEVLLPTLSWTYQDCYRLNLTFLPTLEPLHTACLCLRLQNRTCVLLLFWGLLFVLGLGWGWRGVGWGINVMCRVRGTRSCLISLGKIDSLWNLARKMCLAICRTKMSCCSCVAGNGVMSAIMATCCRRHMDRWADDGC